MKAEQTQFLVLKSQRAVTVEIDTEAAAAYVRFKRARIVKTVRHSAKWPIVTIDLDARNEVVGVEFVGVKRFDLRYLLKHVPLKAPPEVIARASYVSAEADLVAA